MVNVPAPSQQWKPPGSTGPPHPPAEGDCHKPHPRDPPPGLHPRRTPGRPDRPGPGLTNGLRQARAALGRSHHAGRPAAPAAGLDQAPAAARPCPRADHPRHAPVAGRPHRRRSRAARRGLGGPRHPDPATRRRAPPALPEPRPHPARPPATEAQLSRSRPGICLRHNHEVGATMTWARPPGRNS